MACHRSILLLACVPLFGQQYTISTVAGYGATGTVLSNPTTLALDPAGNLYVGDWDGYIRKIWISEGSATIVAGTGILGYGGDGGQATNAMFGKAVSIALDSAANLYIADGYNNRIRRVDAATGIVTTVAGTGAARDSGDGGPGVNAGVSQPTGIAVDSAGNLYFSSSWSRVRRLDAKTGTIETVAGQAVTSFGGDGGPALEALFWDPVPMVVKSNGDLYLADYENSRIRMISGNTGIVTTLAGSGGCALSGPPFEVMVCQSGFAGDGGPAGSALLNHPQAAALDSAGNLFIADTINHRIRKVDAVTGLIYTIAGNGTSGYSGDRGPALAAEITFPSAIAVDQAGRVYFADESNNRIRVLTPATPLQSQLRQSERR